MKNNFAYFIASYGKPEFIPTLKSLERCNAKYPIYIVVSTDDPKFEEYKQYENLLVFERSDYYDQVDAIGVYNKTHKICTYSRLAVEDFARQLGVKYIGYLFDDIMSFSLRYLNKEHKISAIQKFNIDDMMDMYISLLNSSNDIYLTGPPNSAYYIGVNEESTLNYSQRFGNMIVYDIDKKMEPYKASMMEDMTIILNNNMRGKLSICPFGLQVNCREPAVTGDSYKGMSLSEYIQQKSIMSGGIDIGKSVKDTHIPYKNFTPKIIDEKYRQTETIGIAETDLWS